MTIAISTPRITRKSRMNGSDIYSQIEVGPVNEYGGIDPLYIVEGRGNFEERTPAKADDEVWYIYKLWQGGRQVKWSGPLTRPAALKLAREYARLLVESEVQ